MIDPAEKRYRSSSREPNDALDPSTSHGIMARLVGHGKRVLDVGCANGYLSREMTAAGNRVTGIDHDAQAVDEARASCERALVVDLDTQSFRDALDGDSFDVIVFGDVLEHVRDPWRVLSEARSFLSPHGYVVLSIPNIAHGNVRLSLLRGAFDYARFGLLDDTHLRFFTLRSIRELCIRAGFKIDTIERTKVALFDDNELVPPAPEREFGADLLSELRRDPEHDTLQFVVRATPVADGDHLRIALDELAGVETKLAAAQASIEHLERRLEDRTESDERAELQERVAALSAELAEREGALVREAQAAADTADERIALAEEIAVLRAREEDRENELERVRDEATELRSNVIEASRSVGEAYALRSAVDRAHETLAAVHDSMQAKITAAEMELAQVRSALSQAEVDAGALRVALSEMRREYESLDAASRGAESERERLTARLAEVEHLARTREAATAATLADLREALAKSPATTLAVPAAEPARVGSATLARLDQELQRAERARRVTVDAFARHVDAETAMVRAELAEIDALIRRIQSGRLWSAKSALRRIRGALPGGRARV